MIAEIIKLNDGHNDYTKMIDGSFIINTAYKYDLFELLKKEVKIKSIKVTNRQYIYVFSIGDKVIDKRGIVGTIQNITIDSEDFQMLLNYGDYSETISYKNCLPCINETEENAVKSFNKEIIRQINNNKYKGNFLNVVNYETIITELEYHKAKLMIAVKENNKSAIKEFSADIAIYLIMLNNSQGIYDKSDDEEEDILISNIMYSDSFMKMNIFDSLNLQRKTNTK